MLFAERHGKLGRDGSRAHDRAEDLLTSTAFQLLRYLPLEVGLLAVLRRVRAIAPDGRVTTDPPAWPNLDDVTEVKYDPWPPWGTHGEPDMVVELLVGTRSVGRLVIEVKLDAGKSGEASEDAEGGEEVTTDAADPDQLRKYWQGLRASAGGPALGVVYLTSHVIPPTDELAASVAREPGKWLGWLSWRDVWSALKTSELLPARDLTAILAAKGQSGFDSFNTRMWTPPALPRNFWVIRPTRWFSRPVPAVPHGARFWRTSTGAS